MANVSQLQPVSFSTAQITSSEAPEKDADFLALRLLNKRARLRLSPVPLDLTAFPGKVGLLAIANSKGWFAAVIRDVSGAPALILSPLADLRSALKSASSEDEQVYKPQRRAPINGAAPHILTFACNDTRMLLGLLDGNVQVYTSDQLLSAGEGPVQPVHVFAASSSVPLLSVQPNPGDIPELVAVLRDCSNSPGSLAVELLDVQKLTSSGGWMAGKSPSTTPTSISWSPKGKQLALGLQSGDIICFSPSATATPKTTVPRPPSANNMSVISVRWLSTSSFHTIYAPPGQSTPDVEQIHFYMSFDSKSNSAQAIRFNNPYLPFPGLRPPGEFLVSLRSWNPSKVLLFIGDSTSSDIGLIGSVADDSGERWHNFSLEETSTPSLPLDKDQNDTILLGLDVDLTSDESYHHSTASGEALELPAHPIMYVYASDGTILGWHVLNVTGASYPGMVAASNVSTSMLSVPAVPSTIVRELSSDMQTTPTTPTTTAPVEAVSANPPATGFGQPSTFGSQGPTFGQTTVFGQAQFGFGQQPTSAFGKASSFGPSVVTPTFGSTSTPSAFGQPSKSTFGSTAPPGGFGAFSSAAPAKFGQSMFGFGGPSQTAPTLPPSTSIPEESMAADDIPSFDSLGLGSGNSRDADSKPSIFGKPSISVPSSQQPTDGSLIKPGTGFGAFAGFDQKSPFATATAQQPTATFGFGAFASGNQSAFAMAASKTGPSAMPVWATGNSSKPPGLGSFGALTNALGQPTEPLELKTPSVAPQTAPSAFVKPGAFGELPKESPFFTPKLPDNKSASAFALSATPTSGPPGAGSAQPTFGISSMPGAELQKSQNADSKSSVFGRTSMPAILGQQSSDGSLIKPGTGFAAFAEEKGSFAKPSAFSSAQQPTAVFGFSPFAPSAQSAFTAPSSKSGSSAKPVWATGDLSKPAAESPETKTVSAIPPKTTDTSTTPASSASQFALRDSVTLEDDSRSPSPAPIQTKVTTSVFSSSGPGPATGAFSTLQTIPAAFVKPTFGTFGELPKDSPFFAPKPSESKPLSALALSTTSSTPTSTPPKAGSTQPTFGATSMPGGVFKSAFPPVPTTPAPQAPASSTGAFSAFSSGGGGFAALISGGSKSFSDLLRSTEEEKPTKIEPTEAVPMKPAAPPRPLVSTTPAEEPPKLPSVPTPQPEEEVSKLAKVGSDKVSTEPKEKAAETILTGEPSLESISSSTSSSFVKVSAEEQGEAVEEGAAGEELHEETESLPSSEAPSEAEDDEYEPSEEEESEVSEEEESDLSEGEGTEELSETAKGEVEEEARKVTEPTEIPLPITPASTRSPSTTPKAEPPKISISVSPPPQTSSLPTAPPPRVSPVRDLGITPPGSPVKDTPALVQVPVPVAPKTSPPTTSPFSLAPRTNNRPIRSSPLATSSLVLEGEVDKPPVSKSAPPAITAQPAAPKAPFGQWTPPSSGQPTDDTPRPKTPPTSSLFSVSIEKPTSSIFAPTTTPATTPPVFTPPSKAATTPVVPPSTPGPSPLTFTPSTSFSPRAPSPAIPSPRGPNLTPPLTKVPSPASPSTSTPEQGMHAECHLLVTTLSKELENLKQLAVGAAVRTADLRRPSGVAHQKADLSDPCKWTFGDIVEYGTLLIDVQVDIKGLKLQRVSLRKTMKELDSNILKVNTRKEEIARFNRAKTDTEFAKMLKVRTLAPEYSETQSQLRKNMRAIRDRVQKLEDHLQASKKRIHEFRTGRPSIRPPSLDTVNRTLRNIDLAIDQQKREMSYLRYRMTKLEIPGGVGSRDQLTVSSLKRPRNVTPNVAITTAAALNAERSAQKLKKAMLASRTQPLLNTTAIASPIPMSFQTPQKTTVAKSEVNTPEGIFSSLTTPVMSFPSSLPCWAPPSPSEFGSSTSSYDITPSRNRGGTKHHQKPIMLKKSPVGPTTTLPAVSPFEWQPVEPVKPVSSLPFSLRPAGSS